MLAAIASWFAIFEQGRRERKNKAPIVMPGIKHVNAKIENILSDWDEEGQVPKKFTNTKLPIWNYGESTIFNIGYCFYLENIDYYKEMEDINKNDLKTLDHNHKLIMNEDNELHVYYENINQQRGVKTCKIFSYIRNINLIKPNEQSEILL